MASSKIAVTGATGFIGRYVLCELTKRELDICAVTRSADRLADFGNRISVIEMDIGQSTTNPYDKLGCPDALIHLAWDGLPNYRSLSHLESELPKQYRFLKLCIEGGLRKLIVAGTCFEYGMSSGALTEDMPAVPTTIYGYAKDALRRQLEFLKQQHAFDLAWLRLFYLYGKGQPKTSLYTQLDDAASHGDKTFNMSGGEQLRDYLPVEEVARLIVEVALQDGDLGIVNICSGTPISVRRLAENWLRARDSSMQLNLGCYPYPDYEPMAFWGDRRKLDAILGAS